MLNVIQRYKTPYTVPLRPSSMAYAGHVAGLSYITTVRYDRGEAIPIIPGFHVLEKPVHF